jgi:hypothetical protein
MEHILSPADRRIVGEILADLNTFLTVVIRQNKENLPDVPGGWRLAPCNTKLIPAYEAVVQVAPPANPGEAPTEYVVRMEAE